MSASNRGILSPATLLLGRLRLSRKFLLILLVFIIPLAYMSWTVVAEKQRQVRFHQMQQSGLIQLDKASTILSRLSRLRDRTYASALGYRQGTEEGAKVSTGIESALAELEAAGSTSSRRQLGEVQRLWQESNTEAGDALTQHTLGFELSLAMRQYLLRLAQDYQLLLGTDLASYQLSHVSGDRLIYATDLTSALRGLGSGIIARGHFTPDSFIKISYYAGELDSSLDDLARAYAVIGQSHPQLQQRAEQSLAQTNDYLTTVRSRVIDPDRFEISAGRYAIEGEAALQSLARLQKETVETLNRHLADNIEEQSWLMYQVVGISLTIIVLVIYLFSGFYASMKQGIQEINTTLANIARGDLARRAEVQSRDEIRTIADNLNHTAGQLTELVKIAYSRQDEAST